MDNFWVEVQLQCNNICGFQIFLRSVGKILVRYMM